MTHARVHKRDYMRVYRMVLKERAGQTLLIHVRNALPPLPASIRSDVEQALVLAILEGDIQRPIPPETIQRFVTDGFKTYADGYGALSLETVDHDGRTLGERVGVY